MIFSLLGPSWVARSVTWKLRSESDWAGPAEDQQAQLNTYSQLCTYTAKPVCQAESTCILDQDQLCVAVNFILDTK
jgi:hypothetical protein